MEMLSLYDYLNRAAGAELGKKVAAEAGKQGVPIETKEISNPSYEGKILMYPKQFLDNYFDSPPPVEPTRPQAEEDDLPF
jgi:hypothetical protein|tara:strand:- start:425 stop:664 length:240 start_codon:yes stop_codon:yes gene_type:complete